MTEQEFARHPDFALDLTKTAFRFRHGDLTVLGSWYGAKREPCLVLVPTGVEDFTHVKPCVVLLSSAYLWDGRHENVRYNVQTTLRFAEALGRNPANQMTHIRIANTIMEHIDDLLRIPPFSGEKDVAAYAEITESGRTREAEILDYVH